MKRRFSQVRAVCAILVVLSILMLSSCAYVTVPGGGALPPVLTQEDIVRPYTSLGRINIVVEQYIAPISDLQTWGEYVLRKEAARMGADAVMFPEISARPAPHLVIPGNEYRATGVAIRFK